MKHKKFVLGVIIGCLLALTACGSETPYNTVEGSKYHTQLFTNETISNYVTYLEDEVFEKWYLSGITPENFDEKTYFELAMNYDQMSGKLTFDDAYFKVNKSGYDSWYKAVNDIGFSSKDTLQSDIFVEGVEYYINNDDELVIDATLKGTKHTALMEIYMGNDFNPTDIGVTVNKTTGEKLENAGLNTLLGMGMAFTVLIIIALVISLFPLINKLTEKKPETNKEITEKSIETVTSQIAEKEELTDDSELIAVISAAIAAYEASQGTGGDGFVVRSVRKVGKASNWKKA